MITPRNEIETVILFSQLTVDIPHIDIVSFDGTYPDAKVSWNGEIYRTEFEFAAFNFYMHKHDPLDCDLIICWQDDYPDAILPVISLSNPDWIDQRITLVKTSEKLAGYWKRRALDAESKLFRVDKPIRQSLPTELSIEDEELIIGMVKDGSSGKIISETLWGIGKFGQFYNAKIRRVLDKHGIEINM